MALRGVTYCVWRNLSRNPYPCIQRLPKNPILPSMASSFEVKLRCCHTIYALSSGHGKCGVAVIRVSGNQTKQALTKLMRVPAPPCPRMAVLSRLCHPTSGEPVDRGLVLWFPGPHSFTGEDCCELHVHGGLAVISGMLDALGALPGLRHAEAGEFTKRAFQNGKLDLTKVEGLADLIHAETEAQRKQALRQMEGCLSRLYMDWRERLVKCTANVEAYIDFSEEENIEETIMEEVRKSVASIKDELERHLADNRRGERLRSGVQVAIVGEPNVGKSSLLNALCQRPAAIVSPFPGTTRDVVESAINLAGYPVLVSDTAGLRETRDMVEGEGVRRALLRAQQADVQVLVLDSADLLHRLARAPDENLGPLRNLTLTSFVLGHLRELGLMGPRGTRQESDADKPVCLQDHSHRHSNMDDAAGGNTEAVSGFDRSLDVDVQRALGSNGLNDVIVVFNKCDLVDGGSVLELLNVDRCEGADQPAVCVLSCQTGDGMSGFLELLQGKVQSLCASASSVSPSLTQARHRDHLNLCASALAQFMEGDGLDDVMAAHHLRKAIRHLGKVTGKVTSEEILGVIFRDFCIGK